MPFATRDGIRIYWRMDGSEDQPPLLLLNSIGTDMGLWDAVVPSLVAHFRLLRIDARGHGASDAPPGDYDLAELAADVTAVMDAAGVARAPIAGVSLGGMIAMQLALDWPERVAALALICTSAAMDRKMWDARIETVRMEGTRAIAEAAIDRFLSPVFARDHSDVVDGLKRSIVAQPDAGYAGAAAAIRDMTLIDRLGDIAVPAQIISGLHDCATPFAGHGDILVRQIPGAQHRALECAHLPPIEAPAALAASLISFFIDRRDVAAATMTLFDEGLINRRRILGDEWVDHALATRTSFNGDFQALITRIAWHEIWGRPGLDDRTRRLLVIAITASLGRWEEYTLHVRSGLARGGFTRDELKEVLMQTAIYAGVPSANHAFAAAGAIIAELDGAEVQA